MATTIDQKVVELKFDNRDFEKNTKVSMSTLDKLKSKLHLKGASDGLNDVAKAAKKVNMNGLASGIQTVSAKFSAMEVVGVTALANITNSAINAGKNILRSLTVAPVSEGWKEYELTMNTIQTISNSTGKSVDEIKSKLKSLDDYADKTVYSTADMFNNIYKFTNAGIDLDTATKAMIGIANATADAGQGAQQASIAYYNLAQSLSTGYLTTIDYKSLNLANIATKDLKQNLADTAIEMGTLTKVGDDLYSTGNKTYNLQQLFTEALSDQWATTDVMMKVFGDYADEETEIGKRATKAATEVKTFTGMLESLKASAGTGWKETWQIIFGDLDQAKEMWTGLANFVGGIIGAVDNFRNELLGNAFNFNGFKGVINKINDNAVVRTMSDISEKVRSTSRSLEEYQGVVSRVWKGDYNNVGDNPDRFDLLSKDGWNADVVQELVNKGYQYKLTIDDCKKAEEKYGIIIEETTAFKEDKIEATEELTEKQLEELDLSKEEIKMYKQLERASIKYGISIDELLAKMEKSTGRDLLFGKKKRNEDGTIAVDDKGNEIYETVGVAQNISAALINIFNSIKKAWTETFEGLSSVDLYLVFENINKFSLSIKKATENEKGMRNLTDTFKGLFAIIKLISTLVGGGFKIAWTIFKTILQTCGVSVLDFTGAVGNLISRLVNFITENEFVINGIVFLTKIIAEAIISVYKFASGLISINDVLHTFQNGLNKFKKNFSEWIKGLKETDNIPKYIFEGLINGIKSYSVKAWEAITNFAAILINAFKEKLGIHSPSKEFFYAGVDIVKGLYNGIISLVGTVYNLVKTVGEKIINIVKNMDFGALLLTTLGAGTFTFALGKVAKIINLFANGIQGINNVISNASKVLKSFSGVLKAVKVRVMVSSLKSLAIAIAILVGSIVVLTLLDENKMWNAVDCIGALVGMLVSIIAVAGIFSKGAGGVNFAKLATVILAIGLLFGIAGSVVKKMGGMNVEDIAKGIIVITFFVDMIVALMAATKLLLNSKNIDKFGKMILKIGVVFYLMGMTVKKLGKLKPEQVAQGTMVLSLFTGMIVGLMAATKLLLNSKNIDKFGNTILKIGVVFYLMGMTVKKLGKMNTSEVIQGTAVLMLFTGMIVGLMAATKLIAGGNKDIKGIGQTLQAVGIAILLMGITCKLLGNMEVGNIIKGSIAVAALTGIVIGLIYAIKQIGDGEIKNINKTLLSISVMIMTLAFTAALLSIMSVGGLAKGIIAIGFLSLFVGGLIYSTKHANNLGKSLTPIIIAIGLLAIIVIALSLIEPKRLASSTAAIGILMGIFALIIKCASQMKNSKVLAKNLATMIGVIGVLAAITVGLSLINGSNAIQSCAGVMLLTTSLVGMLYALNKIGKINTKNLKSQIISLMSLIVVIAGVAAVLYLLKDMNDVTQSAIGLSILIGAMTIVIYALGKIGSGVKDALLGIAGLAGLMLILYAAVGVLALMSGIKNAGENATILAGFITVLTIVLLLTAAVGVIYTSTAGLAATGLAGLLGLLVILYGLIGVLALMNFIKNAENNCNLLINLMTVMTDALFKISLVGPLALMAVTALGALMIMMPIMIAFATYLGVLMTYIPQLQEFINIGLPIMIQVAGAMGEMIGAFVSGAITQISEALPIIGTNLSKFMKNAEPFVEGMKTVDGKVLEGVAIITGTILALTAASFINGIVSFLQGGKGFSKIGTELSKFALNALPFLLTMATIKPGVMDGVKSLSGAILALTAANVLDGLTKFITKGKSSLSKFGKQIGPLGKSLREFSDNIGTFEDQQVKTVECAGKAIEAMANAAEKLPKSGGYWQLLFGEGSLAEFADDMPVVGENIRTFISNLGTFGDDQLKTAEVACKVIEAMAKAAEAVPKEKGLWQKIFGSNGLTEFADDMPKVAKGVKDFISGLEGVDEGKEKVAASAAEIIKGVAELAKIKNLDEAGEMLPGFGDNLVSFGSKMKSFINEFKEFSEEDVNTVNGNLTLIVEAAHNLMDTFSTEIDSSTDAVVTAVGAVTQAATDALASVDVIKTTNEKGKDFVNGFVKGIADNKDLAKQAAIELGKKANEGISIGINSNSPSKEAMKRGNYFGEGFIMGIESYSSKVYSTAKDMGIYARDGLNTAIAKISSLIDLDADNQPTIRPVLDLSEINSGVNQMNNMFDTVRIGTTLDAISYDMRQRNQNGNNDDVISAIDRLGNNINRNNGDTYNINGITYDDQSAVSEAVQTLIRAAMIERRS